MPTDNCNVSLTLSGSAAAHNAAKKRRRLRVGTAKGRIAGGKTGKLNFKLTPKGLALLKGRKGHKLRVTVAGSSKNRAGQATAIKQKLTLKGKAARRK